MSELSKTVAHDMMVRIIGQEFDEDQAFPNEADLCSHYGVSRVVIREAKKRLQALGMVHSRKKTGSLITPRINWNFFNQDLFDVYMQHSGRAHEHMEDYFSLRLLIEPHLAAQVAQEHSPKFEQTLNTLLQEMHEALEVMDHDRWLQADLNFHVGLYQESGNMLVLPMANLMRPLFVRGFNAPRDTWSASLLKHRQLAEAILSHDAEQAFHYARLIVRNGREDYLVAREQALSGRQTL